MTNLGKKIAETRAKRKISQEELAFLIRKSVKTIRQIERNEIVPDQDTIFKLSNILEIPVSNLTNN